MILSYPALENPLKFNDGIAIMAVVENEIMFSSLISDLCHQIGGDDGPFIFSDNGKDIDLSKYADIVLSPFSVNLNDRSLVSSMQKEMCSIAVDENNNEAIMRMLSNIQGSIDNLRLNADIEVDYDEPSINALLKSVNMRFHESDDVMERLCDYISISAIYGKKKLMVFVNALTYFNHQQMGMILNHAFNVKMHILLLENHMSYRLADVEIRIIDKDLCEF